MSAKQIAAAISTKDSTGPQRFAFLDFLRFAAALAVVSFHLIAFTRAWEISKSTDIFPKLGELAKFGGYGVDLFFVISGFVILASANGRTVRQFAISRISRVFPAFWAAVFLAAVLFLFIWDGFREVDLPKFLLNLTMTNMASGVGNLDGVFWTLWSELRFYVLIALFMRFGITPSRILVLCTIWPVLASMSITYGEKLVMQLLIAPDAALFSGGMMIYFVFKYGHSFVAYLVLLLNIFTACQRTIVSRGQVNTDLTGIDSNPTLISIIVVSCFALVMVAVLTPVRNLRAPWMTWLGLFTYPLYLVHEVWGWWIISLFKDTHSAYFTLGVALAFVFVLAFALLKLVDQPGGRWLKKRLEKDFAALDAINVNAPVSPKAVEKSFPASGSDFDTPAVPVRNEQETDRASS